MKGAYILLMELIDDEEIEVGKLGTIKFRRGYYAYVGSALNNMEARIKRHLSKEKKLWWHIDYLLTKAEIKEVICMESDKREECEIAKKIAKQAKSIKGFGCSDCKCRSHLFHSQNLKDLTLNH
ncbi:MAG: GIY-YIG nuclease family protein [Candidatus Altiarchaeota archaeon]|nr:GIY-YIG nuclease family protein [Candidatus Altiarchaeota archaeon]